MKKRASTNSPVGTRLPPKEQLGVRNLLLTLRLLRPYHWMKNVLVLVPLLWALEDAGRMWLPAMTAFAAFCVAASLVYVVNDLVDLERDRGHARKLHRPLASGAISSAHAFAVIRALLLLLALICWHVAPGFRRWLWLYLGVANAYTFWLKRRRGIDTLTIAFLHTLRLLAGGAMFAVPVPSLWTAFSFFFFLSLALLKRCADLNGLRQNCDGRAEVYSYRHLPMLIASGEASGIVAALTLGLGLSGPGVREAYRTDAFPVVLWCSVVLWLARLWWLAVRAEAPPDPFPFALKDSLSYATAGLVFAIVLYARY